MDLSAEPEPVPVLCPRCRRELAPHDIFPGGRHATVAICVSCGGQWMNRSDLERLSEVVEPVVVEWRRLGPPEEQAAGLDCPECQVKVKMAKVSSARDDQVVLDQCGRCGGVWLDGNELRAIQQDSLLTLLSDLGGARSVH